MPERMDSYLSLPALSDKAEPGVTHSFQPGIKHLLAGVLLLCIVLVTFYPNVTSFFHSDDLDQIWFVSKDGPLGIWRNTPQDYFRPLASINLWAEWQLWGRNPAGYHL